MQITFDPMNKDEAAFIARIVGLDQGTQGHTVTTSTHIHTIDAVAAAHVAKVLAHADRPDVGATPEVPFAPSAAPLPPDAPSFAAAELFPTAPTAASIPPAPPVPSPLVPSAPTPAPAPSASVLPVIPAGDVDAASLPWDERIHASTKTKNADGTWRQRRGLNDPALLKRVEAELRARAPSADPLSPAPGAAGPGNLENGSTSTTVSPSASDAQVSGNVPPAPTAAMVSVLPPPVTSDIPPAPVVPPAPAGAASTVPTAPPVPALGSTVGQPIDLAGFFKMLTENIASGKLQETFVHEVMAWPEVDLLPTQMAVLAVDAAKRQIVADEVRAHLGL